MKLFTQVLYILLLSTLISSVSLAYPNEYICEGDPIYTDYQNMPGDLLLAAAWSGSLGACSVAIAVDKQKIKSYSLKINGSLTGEYLPKDEAVKFMKNAIKFGLCRVHDCGE